MKNASQFESSAESLAILHREQLRVRIWLAVVLLGATCAFALSMSWLAQDSPLQPLLLVKTSLFALLSVYAIGVGVALFYARWNRGRCETALGAAR